MEGFVEFTKTGKLVTHGGAGTAYAARNGQERRHLLTPTARFQHTGTGGVGASRVVRRRLRGIVKITSPGVGGWLLTVCTDAIRRIGAGSVGVTLAGMRARFAGEIWSKGLCPGPFVHYFENTTATSTLRRRNEEHRRVHAGARFDRDRD